MLEFKDVAYSYNDFNTHLSENSCIKESSPNVTISGCIESGKIVSLIGCNGSGKSTIAKLACGMLMPVRGAIVCDGCLCNDSLSRIRLRSQVGYVGQDPFNQIVSTVCKDEVAFGPRNMGLSDQEIDARVHYALSAVGLLDYIDESSTQLSGGQQQRLAIAGVLAMHPSYLVLDEATSQLDSTARSEIRLLTRRLANLGVGILQITHDPLEILSSDIVWYLDKGRIVWSGSVNSFVEHNEALLSSLTMQSVYTSLLCRLIKDFHYPICLGIEPSSVYSWALKNECFDFISQYINNSFKQLSSELHHRKVSTDLTVKNSVRCLTKISCFNISFSYNKKQILHDISLSVHPGEILLLCGATGSGKSSLARILSGLFKPDTGQVLSNSSQGIIGLTFQRPEDQLFLDTVEHEISFGPTNLGFVGNKLKQSVDCAANAMGIRPQMYPLDPRTLSGGQMRCVAIASVLSMGCSSYIFDEPTSGLDASGRVFLHHVVTRLAGNGCPIIVISHDIEEWIGVANRIAFLNKGNLLWEGTLLDVLSDVDVFEKVGIKAPESFELLGIMNRVNTK